MNAQRNALKQRFDAVDLYPVTCEPLSDGRTDMEVLDGIIAGGARIVQLRDKESTPAAIYRKALRFRERTANAGLLLIINNHVDICIAVDADGVHLGQDDLPLEAARKLLPGRLIGASSHNLDEALAAQSADADYVNVGPLFTTGTKTGLHRFLGVDAVTRIAPHLRIPFTVMGGINTENLDAVLNAGARKVAVVTAITRAPDIPAEVRTWRARITRHRGATGS